MKKVLALVLAAVLAIGTTTVAFAEDEMFVPEDYAYIDQATGTIVLEKDDKVLAVDWSKYFVEDDGKITSLTGSTFGSGMSFTPGDTLYFRLTGFKINDVTKPIVDSGNKVLANVSDLKDYRVSYSIDEGKNMIASAKFVKMGYTSGSAKSLFIELKTNDNFIMESQNVSMDLKLSAKNGAIVSPDGFANGAINGTTVMSFSADFGYTEDTVSNGYYTVDGTRVLSFDDDADDVTLCFDEDVEIQGNMKGQKDVLVRMKTSNDTLEEKYPDATLRLFDSTKDTFKRDVNVTLPYESAVEKPYLYEVDAKGTLTKLYGGAAADKAVGETAVKYDDVTGAFTFKTKTLGNYVISETELKSSSTGSTDVDAPAAGDKPTDGTQPNPGTGANDFVGLAVALAVVSVAGIAVAKRK